MYFGFEKIRGLEGKKISDFWKWACSDLIIPTNRQDFATYLVADSLELTKMPRINWENADLRYRKKKIAIRSSAYVEHWKQKRPRRLSFDVSPKKGLDAKTEESVTFRNRHPEIYVFAVVNEKDLKKIDLLNLDQWQFYIVDTDRLDEHHYDTRKLGIRALQKLASPIHITKVKSILDDIIDLDLTERQIL